MSEWTPRRLGDVVELTFGSAFPSSEFTHQPVGPRLLRGENVGFGETRWDLSRWWPADRLPGFEHLLLSPGDVVLAMDRPWLSSGLKYAVIRPDDVPALLVQRTTRLRGGRDVDQAFLQWIVASSDFADYIVAVQTGSTIPHISGRQIADYRIAALPPLAEQRAIANVLGALDKKIESNRRQTDLARVLALETLRRASVGGVTVRVGDIADVRKGLSYKGSGLMATDSSLPMVNLGNFGRDGWFDRTALKPYCGEYQERHVVHGGDLVVANTDLTQQRAILGRPALVPDDLNTALFTHHVYAVRPNEPSLAVALWAALSSDAFRVRAEGFATGTTVAGLPRDALVDFEFQLPSKSLLDGANSLLRTAWAAELESSTLVALRDALLPEVLSGRIRVPAQVEAAG